MTIRSKKYALGFAHGLMFHRFHREGQRPAGQGSVSPKQFEAILEYVGIKNILTPAEWLAKLKKNRLARRDVCLTIDDGLRCQFDVCLPVLEKHGLKAFWFIFSSVFEGQINKAEVYQFFAARYFLNSDHFYEEFLSRCPKCVWTALKENKFLRYAKEKKAMFPFYSLNDLRYRFVRNELFSQAKFEAFVDLMIKEKGTSPEILAKNIWMSNAQLKKLIAQGHYVGLHSYTHPFVLAQLSQQRQKEEYQKNSEHIHRVTGHTSLSMAHPLNSYNQTTLEILKKMGIVCGFRSNVSTVQGKMINPTSLELAREDATNILKVLKI